MYIEETKYIMINLNIGAFICILCLFFFFYKIITFIIFNINYFYYYIMSLYH